MRDDEDAFAVVLAEQLVQEIARPRDDVQVALAAGKPADENRSKSGKAKGFA